MDQKELEMMRDRVQLQKLKLELKEKELEMSLKAGEAKDDPVKTDPAPAVSRSSSRKARKKKLMVQGHNPLIDGGQQQTQSEQVKQIGQEHVASQPSKHNEILRRFQQMQSNGETVSEKKAKSALCFKCLQQGHEQWHDYIRVGTSDRFKKTERKGPDGRGLKCINDAVCMTCGEKSSSNHNWKNCRARDDEGKRLPQLALLEDLSPELCALYVNVRTAKELADGDESVQSGESSSGSGRGRGSAGGGRGAASGGRGAVRGGRGKAASFKNTISRVGYFDDSDEDSAASVTSASSSKQPKVKVVSQLAKTRRKIDDFKVENDELKSKLKNFVVRHDELKASLKELEALKAVQPDREGEQDEFESQTIKGCITRDLRTGALNVSGFNRGLNAFSDEMEKVGHPLGKFTAERDNFAVLKAVAKHAEEIVESEKTAVQAAISVSWDSVLNSSLTHLPITRTRMIDGEEVVDEGMIFYGFDTVGLSVLTSLIDVFMNSDGALCRTSKASRSVLCGHVSITSQMLNAFVDMFMEGNLQITPYFDDALNGSSDQDEMPFVDLAKLDDYVVGKLRENDPEILFKIDEYVGGPIAKIHELVKPAHIIGVCFKRDVDSSCEVQGAGKAIALNQLLCEYMNDILRFNSSLDTWSSDIWVVGGPPMVTELTKRSPFLISVASYGSYVKKRDIGVTYRPLGKYCLEQSCGFSHAKTAQAIACSNVADYALGIDEVESWGRNAFTANGDLMCTNPLMCYVIGDELNASIEYSVSAFNTAKRTSASNRKFRSLVSPVAGPEFQTTDRSVEKVSRISTSQFVLSETPDLLTMSVSTDGSRRTSGIRVNGDSVDKTQLDSIRDAVREYFYLINNLLNGSLNFGLRALVSGIIGYQMSWGNSSFEGEGLDDDMDCHEALMNVRPKSLKAWRALLPGSSATEATIKNAGNGSELTFEMTNEQHMLSVSDEWVVKTRKELCCLPDVAVTDNDQYENGFRSLDILDLELIKLSLMGSLSGFMIGEFSMKLSIAPINGLVTFNTETIDGLLRDLKSDSDEDQDKGEIQLRYDYNVAYDSRVNTSTRYESGVSALVNYKKLFERPLSADGLNELRFKSNQLAGKMGSWRMLTNVAANLDALTYAGVGHDEADKLALNATKL